jgi:phenylacetic acid degradation operon negative regulatory protein
VTNPYDIEEIFPDDAASSVRLPRRQAGNAPQGLAVTLLSDYTLRNRAWLPSAAIVSLLAESGVTQASARTTISRLARRGVLEGTKHGRHSSYRLTEPAAAFLAVGGRWVVAPAGDGRPWDGRWTLVAFSLPKEHGTQRHALRGQLRWFGFAPLFDGLWISPRELSEKVAAQLAQLTPGAITVFRAEHAEVGAAAPRHPLDAWDIDGITQQYSTFIEQWTQLLPRIRARQIPGAEAVRARTEVMDTYRRLRVFDPQLPTELLPAGWKREPAGKVFAAVYDGLADAAQEHVRAVATDIAGGTHAEIEAHTVADLLDGLPGSSRHAASSE